jgi:Domain of unknown function (DUF4365)
VLESTDATLAAAKEIPLIAAAGVPALSAAWSTLSLNGQKARYGVAYVRSICAQAGVGLDETSPDEDVLAADCAVRFAVANVSVQVKCTSGLTIRGRSASWPIRREWAKKWQESWLPVYFVLVIAPDDADEWIDQRDDGTFHRTAAFWRRIRRDESLGSRIDIPKSHRLQASTLGLWHADLMEIFTPAGSGP